MDENRPRGSAAGGLLGDNKLQAEGEMGQASGQLQNAYGLANGCSLLRRQQRSRRGAAPSAWTSARRSRSTRAA